MTVRGKPVETVSISEALKKFMNCFKNLGIAHNGRVFLIFELFYPVLFVK